MWLERQRQAFLLAIRSDERLWVWQQGAPAPAAKDRASTTGRRSRVVFTTRRVPLETLVSVAGQRWAIEQGFETSKQEIGLDQYEVRTDAAWYRFMTLTLYAHAFLAAMRARQTPRKQGRRPTRTASSHVPDGGARLKPPRAARTTGPAGLDLEL